MLFKMNVKPYLLDFSKHFRIMRGKDQRQISVVSRELLVDTLGPTKHRVDFS